MSPNLPPANHLEVLIEHGATALVARDEFNQTLLAATLYALLLARDETETSTDSDAVELVTWYGEDGPVIPIFTSEARVREGTQGRLEDYAVVEVPGAALFEVLAGTGLPVALNPNCAQGKLFMPGETARLAGAGGWVAPSTAQ